jgi:membrane protein implicated in regulation of membrane protease activity
MNDRSPHMTLPEAWDEIQVFLTGPVVVGPVLPGLLFCVPGIIFIGAPVVIPLVAFGLLLLALWIVVALIAAPVLLVRALVPHVRALVLAHRHRTPKRSAGLIGRRTT